MEVLFYQQNNAKVLCYTQFKMTGGHLQNKSFSKSAGGFLGGWRFSVSHQMTPPVWLRNPPSGCISGLFTWSERHRCNDSAPSSSIDSVILTTPSISLHLTRLLFHTTWFEPIRLHPLQVSQAVRP